jgi:TP901 family phage tail tape measure protein
VAAQSGISFLDFTASLTSVAQGFASGSDAGTSFKTFIQRLSAPTNKAAELMEKIGFNAYDSAGKLKSMSLIAQNLQDSLKGMTQEQKNFTITQLFGADSSRIA